MQIQTYPNPTPHIPTMYPEQFFAKERKWSSMPKSSQQRSGSKSENNDRHQLTTEERSKGGSSSSGNFANDPQRASEAGQKGGSR
jgi:general stress protein YciG